MASVCVNNRIPGNRAFGWPSPRVSFSRDSDPSPNRKPANSPDPVSDPDFIDFEFRLHDPVAAMLPADELFSGGKLVPLQLSKPPSPPEAAAPAALLKPSRQEELIGSGFASASASDIFAVSPKAPTCTSRWRELLRIKRQQQQQQQQQNSPKPDPGPKTPNPTRSSALKQFLHRRSSLTDPNLAEPETLSRLSLSSSDDFPRHSLDSAHKPHPHPHPHPILLNRNPPRARLSSGRVGRSPARRSAEAAAPPPRCASVDSPRMNASGRGVFHGLGRSSSSPSTFNGAVRNKYRGMEWSYSANVRVINVPVPSKAGSVFGFLGGNRGKN